MSDGDMSVLTTGGSRVDNALKKKTKARNKKKVRTMTVKKMERKTK